MKINKKEKERYAVIKFYKNQGINIDTSKITFTEENSPIDVIFEDKKFQIKGFPAGAEEVEGRLDGGEDNIASKQSPKNYKGRIFRINGLKDPIPETLMSLTFDEMKNDIIEVVRKANERYSPDAIKDIILLINDRHNLPEDIIEKDINGLDATKCLGNINFKEIYFVGSNKNLKLYPSAKSGM